MSAFGKSFWVFKKMLLCLFSKSNWPLRWTYIAIFKLQLNWYTKVSLYCGFMEAGSDMRRRSSGREEDDEELQRRRQLQEEQLMKVIISLSSCCFWTPPKKCPIFFCKQFLLMPWSALFFDMFLIAFYSSTLVWDNWYWKKRWKRRVAIGQPFLPVVTILQVSRVGNKVNNEQWIMNTTYTHIKRCPRRETTRKTAWYLYMEC